MALSREEIMEMTGQKGPERTAFYRLDEIRMSGDDGTFTLKEFTKEKNEENRYPAEGLGEKIDGVILKRRWKLFRYEEDGSIASTEYDNKNTDQVTVFPMKDRGTAVAMKERHNLGTQCILYFYVPAKSRVVRLIVRASGLSGEKNPNGEMGLFEYTDDLNSTDTALHEFITTCKGVHREGRNKDGSLNRRKDHYAISFLLGRKLTDSELEKVEDMIRDVHEKTANPAHNVEKSESHGQPEPGGLQMPDFGESDEITKDDIPFN